MYMLSISNGTHFFEVQLCIEMLMFKKKHVFPILIILCVGTSLPKGIFAKIMVCFGTFYGLKLKISGLGVPKANYYMEVRSKWLGGHFPVEIGSVSCVIPKIICFHVFSTNSKFQKI